MRLSGWGRYPEIEAKLCSFAGSKELAAHLAEKGEILARGLGRSYGDSALAERLLSTGRADAVTAFDPKTGLITCEAGVSLAGLVRDFLPQGWFLDVTPGTKFVTVGGAIASDVHGKNHHKDGCFSRCVQSFELMLPDGKLVTCSEKKNRELFLASCGGMGLTGVISSATFKLRKVEGAYIEQTTLKARNLEHVLELFDKNYHYTYSVAWIDCLATGENLGRSLLMLGEHSTDRRVRPLKTAKLSLPVDFPDFALAKPTVALFNFLYYNRIRGEVLKNQVHIDPFFYPLDALHDWNRMYGKSGFTQYQFVLPPEASLTGLKLILSRIAQAGLGSFLGVLKLFGAQNENYLSFPMPGCTLALDFKITPGLFKFLDELDRIVLDHGGRLYLSKDVRMSPETFRRGYPGLEKFLEIRKKHGCAAKFNSLQSKRLGV